MDGGAATEPPAPADPGAPDRGERPAAGDGRRPGDAARLLLALLGVALAGSLVPHLRGRPPPVVAVPVRIDLNRAPQGLLRSLPGVGRVLASRIAAARAERPFASAEDLLRVPGVGPSLVGRIAPHAATGPGRRMEGDDASDGNPANGEPPPAGPASVHSTGRDGDPRR